MTKLPDISKHNTESEHLKEGFVHRKPLSQDQWFAFEIRKLSKLNSLQALWAIFFDWAMIASAIVAALTFHHPAVWIVSLLVIAGRQHALLILMHDAAHFRLFRNRILNEVISDFLLAFPFLISTHGYRMNHTAHHWFLNTKKDPDWMIKLNDPNFDIPKYKPMFWWMLVKDLIGGGFVLQIKSVVHLRDKKKKERPNRITGALRIFFYLGAITIIFITHTWIPVLIFWFLPLFTILPVMKRLRSIAEHFGLPGESDLNMSRNYAGPIWERFFIVPHNIGYHLDHHLYPSVPFFNLPKLHTLLLKHPEYREKGYQNESLLTPRPLSVLRDVTFGDNEEVNKKKRNTVLNKHRNKMRKEGHKPTTAIERIVQAAQMAPSGDNCQPWIFSWNGKTLKISHDENRAKHAFNRANHASYISLGCVLESITIAAKNEGLNALCHYNNWTNQKSPQANVEFERAQDINKADLIDSIYMRTTDRRKYKGGSILDPVFDLIEKESSEFTDVTIEFQNHVTYALMNYIKNSDCYVWENKKAHDDFFGWLRFSKKEKEESRDGLPWKNLGINYFESRILKQCKNYAVQRMLNPIFTRTHKKEIENLILSSAGLGCIAVRSASIENLIEAGGLWMRTWLRLTQAGYALQPFTSATFPIFDSLTGDFPHSPEIENGKKQIQQAFNLPDSEIPLILFRTGKSSPLPLNMRTLRKPLKYEK